MTSKMPVQKLLLNWKDHSGALVSVFETLLEKKALVDCTLAAEGQYLKAHKVVLSACSSYFELLFSQESEKNPIVILKDVKFEELEAAVNFMYKGEVEVCEDRLAAFLEVADSLQITGLGSDTKSQGFKENVSAVKSSSAKSALTRRRQSRKEDSNLQSDDTGLSSNVPTDCDQIRNFESSSFRQSFRKENSSVLTGSTFGVGPSNTVKEEINRDSGDLKNVEQSSVLPSFTSGESVQSEENPVIKTEPETDTFSEEQLDEAERDSEDDVVMLDDQDDWDEPKAENMDAVSTNQQDMNAGWILPDDVQNFSTVIVKEEPGTSASWNEEAVNYGGSASGDMTEPCAGTSAASTGTDDLVTADEEQPVPASVQVYLPVDGSSRFNVFGKLNDTAVQRTPSGLPSKKFSCSDCKELFVRMTDLERHMRSHMCGALPSVSEGNVQLDDPSISLIQQFQKTNQTFLNRTFKCSECDYVTLYGYNIKSHLRMHTGEKPFKCMHCDHAFRDKSNLGRHLMTHTGEKPFKCSQCNYASRRKMHLMHHLRKHMGNTAVSAEFAN